MKGTQHKLLIMMKQHYEKLYSSKFENLKEMDKLMENIKCKTIYKKKYKTCIHKLALKKFKW